MQIRTGLIALAFTLAGCGSYEPNEASCLNRAAVADYGTVSPLSGGGFMVEGSGPVIVPTVITQIGAPLRPGAAGDPKDDYPKPAMRVFVCTQEGE